MSMRPRPNPDGDSLLSRMGKERFVLGFVEDHLRGLPIASGTAARELRTARDRVDASSTEVLATLNEGYGRIRDFEDAAQRLGSTSEGTFTRLEEVAESLRNSLSDTNDLIRGVSSFRHQSQKTANRTEALERTATTVRDQVARLVDLSEQINLLALNSVIEADHTGRQGRPFALLAEEIRAIASQAANEAGKVKQIVEKIETEVLDATGQVGSNEQRFRDGASRASELTPELSALEQSLDLLRNGQEDFRRQFRSLTEHIQDIRSRHEQMTAVSERVNLTLESLGSAMREEQDFLDTLGSHLDKALAGAEQGRSPQEAEKDLSSVRSHLTEVLTTLSGAFKNERELSGGLDNAERLASDQASSASLSQRKAERLDVVAESLAERADFIQARGQDLLAAWESRILDRVLELIGHIDQTAARTHEAVTAIGALEGRVRNIDLVATSIARLTLKIDMLALTGNLEALKAGQEGSGFGAVASRVQHLATESAKVADTIRDSAYNLSTEVAVIRRSLDEAEGVARAENTRSSRVRDNLLALKESLRGLGTELQAVRQATSSGAAQAAGLLKDAVTLVRTTEATTGGIQDAARAIGNTSTVLASVNGKVEKVAIRLEATST